MYVYNIMNVMCDFLLCIIYTLYVYTCVYHCDCFEFQLYVHITVVWLHGRCPARCPGGSGLVMIIITIIITTITIAMITTTVVISMSTNCISRISVISVIVSVA